MIAHTRTGEARGGLNNSECEQILGHDRISSCLYARGSSFSEGK